MASAQDSAPESAPNGSEGVSRRGLLKSAVAGAGALMLGQAGLAAAQSPTPTATPTSPVMMSAPRGETAGKEATSSKAAYAVPTQSGVVIKPIMTVGDKAANGYKMVGIPDGLGATRSGNIITLMMNHEIPSGRGIPRAHGSAGAFVSQWKINKDTFDVIEGKDFARSPHHVHLWDAAAKQYTVGTTMWRRFCSGDLPAITAFRHGALGTSERIYLNGEEQDDDRAFAHIMTGPDAGHSWQIPRFGRLPFENAVASPHSKMKTVVVLLDDGDLSTAATTPSPCEFWVYIGTKQQSGNTIERAGLTNGKLYGMKVFRDQTLVTEESEEFGFGDATTGYVDKAGFTLVEVGDEGDVSGLSATQLTKDGVANDLFRMQRIEDGAWDPRSNRPRDFFFVTTASFDRTSRLYHSRFNDVNLPENGGKIEILLNATPGHMFDDIAIDELGRILIQEDTGNLPWVSRIWLYGIDTGELVQVARHDPELFEPGGQKFISEDEESSGIIDAAEFIGPGWFLFDVQLHKPSLDPELMEEGQLLAMYVPTHLGRTLGRRRTTEMNTDD